MLVGAPSTVAWLGTSAPRHTMRVSACGSFRQEGREEKIQNKKRKANDVHSTNKGGVYRPLTIIKVVGQKPSEVGDDAFGLSKPCCPESSPIPWPPANVHILALNLTPQF